MMEKNTEAENKRKKRVLFVCTHNSSRSQLAEELLRELKGNRWEAYSAGTSPTGVHPAAVQEVVAVCDHAQESCPVVPGGGVKRHQSFEDPAAAKGTEAEVLAVFRRVRDEIRG